MFETGEPFTRAELGAALEQVQDEGHLFLARLSPDVFFARQGPAWYPAEHARHLRKSLQPLTRVLRWPRPVLGLVFGLHRGPSRDFAAIREQYQATLAAGAQAGRFAPAVHPWPKDLASGQAVVLGRLAATVRALRGVLPPWSERALDRYRLPHPILGRLTVREMLAFSVYHHAHHLRRVAERAGELAPFR